MRESAETSRSEQTPPHPARNPSPSTETCAGVGRDSSALPCLGLPRVASGLSGNTKYGQCHSGETLQLAQSPTFTS